MISRVAESCFWLHRYMERAENAARLLEVNLSFVLDASVPSHERWRPFIVVCGEEERFLEFHGEEAIEDGEMVQEYLTWDERNPVAIQSSLRWARENARTIRETISDEMWETLNAAWLWIGGRSARRLFQRDRWAFYVKVKETCQLFHGICHNTVLHEEPFDFMRLGMLLERAGQTARILDVKHHAFGPTLGEVETAVEAAQWLAILRNCGANESFFKRSSESVTGPAVAGFLLLENAFPRSVLHCLDRAWNFLQRIRHSDDAEVGEESATLLRALRDRLRNLSIETILQEGEIHEELTRVVDGTSDVCRAIHADYFDPKVPELT